MNDHSENARKANASRSPEARSAASRKAGYARIRSLPPCVTLRDDRPAPYLVRVLGRYVGYFATLDDAIQSRDRYARQHGLPPFAQAAE